MTSSTRNAKRSGKTAVKKSAQKPAHSAPHHSIKELSPDCPFCPRLVAYRQSARNKYPEWFNSPVPSFGPDHARCLIVGLAPGMKGANRTGRPFTGDYAGNLLYSTLLKFGFAKGNFDPDGNDNLKLVDLRITNAVRCVPPENKPLPEEIATCRPFLLNVLDEMTSLEFFVVLGRIAHETLLRALGLKLSAYPFVHGASHFLPDGKMLFDSYHCSRYNTQTGRLTEKMFHDIFQTLRKNCDSTKP